MPIGTTKNTSSQTSGSPSSPGVTSLALMTPRERDRRLGGLHLFPHSCVQRAAWNVAVDVRLRLADRAGVVELERRDQILRRRLRVRIRVTVAVVVLEPRSCLHRAPRVREGVRMLASR